MPCGATIDHRTQTILDRQTPTLLGGVALIPNHWPDLAALGISPQRSPYDVKRGLSGKKNP